MKWQTLGGRCIYRSATAQVFDNYIYRWLTLNSSALQTVLNKWQPQRPGLNYLKGLVFAAQQQPGAMCLLGLGGAGAVHTLAPLLTNVTLTAIEQNPEVIYLVKQFFMTDLPANVRIITADANMYVGQCQQLFQHIMVDLFTADAFPSGCCNALFFSHCQRLLVPNGTLALNIANRYEQQPLFELIKQQFGRAIVAIPIKACANVILVASNSGNIATLLRYFTNNKQVKQVYWDGIWGYVAELK